MKRWMKFNLVGAIGVGVQLGVLALVRSAFNLNATASTAVAVEAAVVHNFFWHEALTWSDRRDNRRLPRYLRFNVTTGAFSIAGNVALTKLLADRAVPLLLANGIAISICSILNFLINDRLVFVVTKDAGNQNARHR
jgi:putative flippase GtrA